uniref:Uncharacterized protein n=1 Tax=Arundo donax TaxID=35708 RepID=A0A0A9FP99_ARUDO
MVSREAPRLDGAVDEERRRPWLRARGKAHVGVKNRGRRRGGARAGPEPRRGRGAVRLFGNAAAGIAGFGLRLRCRLQPPHRQGKRHLHCAFLAVVGAWRRVVICDHD